MNSAAKPTPKEIRQARVDNPKLRERDLAAQLGVSEGDLVAAQVAQGAQRIEPRVNDILQGLEAVGEVMALTRNESAVHEKIGIYDKVVPGQHASMVLGADIDLRVFPNAWTYGFAVEKRDGDSVRHSLQFFDQAGDAVHKVHLRPTSSLYAYQKLVASLASADQSQAIDTKPLKRSSFAPDEAGSADELRERWGAMTDVHQFFGMLRALKLERRQALDMVGDDYAWLLDRECLSAMFHHVAREEIPIMCFVGNHGCIQIHAGPVTTIKPMGPWINVLDETFHLHLRLDHVREVWAVRKPTKDGHVTSLEAYDADNQLIIQFFGKRHEGHAERDDWRKIAEHLPRIPRSTAA
ncbi:ChuX/HutX family heme-like substrate-binding protein [Mesorhizobium sp. CAU 1741]|uniref:hemin-degrading factor n=1 Tax=Mesorhizobium sp. CAU 1741 TaxID=3140366 RepID=UPI00325B6902